MAVPSAQGAARRRRKHIEEVVSYAVNHPTRFQILIILNEGTFTASEIAEILDQPLNNVSNHLRGLLDAGSIELAKSEMVRNVQRHWYRAVEIPEFSDEEVAAMTPQQKHVLSGLAVQSMIAEIMAGLHSGKMRDDEHLWLAWDWRNVDVQARREIADEQARSWQRIEEIEAESINRVAESGEQTISVLVSQTGFERARKGPDREQSGNDD